MKSKRIYPKVAKQVVNNEIKSIESQLQGGSGCVASMGNITNQSDAQKELDLNDVLNSSMVNKALELFQPETQIRVKPKV